MNPNEISGRIVDAAMKVHSRLGPGLLESAYEVCLTHELRTRGHVVRTQVLVPITYDTLQIECGFRLDLLVDEVVIVELKAVPSMLPVYEAQLLTYLRLSGHRLGLLMNFHERHLKDGITRMVNRL